MKKLLLLPAFVFSLFAFVQGAEAGTCSFSVPSSYCSGSDVTVSFTADTAGQSSWPHAFFAGISGNWIQYTGSSGSVNLGTLPVGNYDFYSFNQGDQCGTGVPWDACVGCGNSGPPPSSTNSTYKKSFSVVNCTPASCNSFLATPSAITDGDSVTLSWNTQMEHLLRMRIPVLRVLQHGHEKHLGTQ